MMVYLGCLQFAPPHGNALGYRYASPNGDVWSPDGWSYGITATHTLARHSATHPITRGHDMPQSCSGTPINPLITAHSSLST